MSQKTMQCEDCTIIQKSKEDTFMSSTFNLISIYRTRPYDNVIMTHNDSLEASAGRGLYHQNKKFINLNVPKNILCSAETKVNRFIVTKHFIFNTPYLF